MVICSMYTKGIDIMAKWNHCPIRSGMNTLEVESLLRQMGANIKTGNKDGHHSVWHPAIGSSGQYNCRRKSAPRKLTNYGRKLWWYLHAEPSGAVA